jgi:hypothetical protein
MHISVNALKNLTYGITAEKLVILTILPVNQFGEKVRGL